MFEDNFDTETKYNFRIRKGCGSHIFKDKRGEVNPGQSFEATPYEVRHIHSKIELLSKDIPSPQTPPRFRMDHRGAGRFNVINEATGEPINDRLLTKKEACELAGIPFEDNEDVEAPAEKEPEEDEPEKDEKEGCQGCKEDLSKFEEETEEDILEL